jgi:hypothetical protein
MKCRNGSPGFTVWIGFATKPRFETKLAEIKWGEMR